MRAGLDENPHLPGRGLLCLGMPDPALAKPKRDRATIAAAIRGAVDEHFSEERIRTRG